MHRNTLLVLLLSLCSLTCAVAQSPSETLAQADEISFGGNPADALTLYQTAQKGFREREQWKGLAEASLGEGFAHLSLGNLGEARTLLESLLPPNSYPKDSLQPFLPDVHGLLGVLYEAEGEYKAALEQGLAGLEYEKSDPDMAPGDLAVSYNNLGVMAQGLADYEQAVAFYTESIRLYEKAEEHLQVIGTQNNLGLTLHRKRELEAAFRVFEEALIGCRVYGAPAKLHGRILINLIPLSADLGYEAYARDFSGRAEKISAQFPELQPWFLANKGYALLMQGKYESSKVALEEALQLAPAEEQSLRSKALFYQAINHRELLDFEKSAENLCEALFLISVAEINECPPDPGQVPLLFNQRLGLRIFHQFALLEQAKEAPEKSLAWFEAAARQANSLRQELLDEGSRLFIQNYVHPVYEDAIRHCLAEMEGSAPFLYQEKALYFMELSKATLLAEHLATGRPRDLQPEESNLLNREKQLRLSLNSLQQQAAQTTGKTEKSRLEATIFKEKEALWKLEKELQEKGIDSVRVPRDSATLGGLQKLLSAGEGMIEYFRGEEYYFALLVTADRCRMVKLEAKAEELDRKVSEFLLLVTDFEAYLEDPAGVATNFSQSAHRLYRELLSPVVGEEDFSALRILPDGKLMGLPFDLLCTETAGEADFRSLPYLTRSCQVSYAYSAGLFLSAERLFQERKGGQNCIAFAPSYAGRAATSERGGQLLSLRGGPGELPATEEEILALSNYFPGNYYFGDSASEDNFRKHAGDYAIIHLAMHGIQHPENGNWSYLDFGGEEDARDSDGRLFTYELQQIPLTAKLAVLSACESGTGNLVRGEGVMSLARGFLTAGVPSVVVSLWKVDDKSTAKLMEYFYAGLSKGMEKSAAMQAARLQFLEEADEISAFPALWGGFVVIGDDHPVEESSGMTWLIVGGLAALLLGWAMRRGWA